ncbi:hypothetical protein MLD38_004284 [Melastoma candidum]|uniref:Uncharacterized protein n=1 Tax=Melastoma candidum TaxID=119954 RepID=A0ACB9S8F5_9MYRT|nr:hypothetical protein MLD38_004284 [Melastoma candidum]
MPEIGISLGFSDMLSSGAMLNSSIYELLLYTIADESDFETAGQMHSLLIKCGFGLDKRIGAGISNVYVKCGQLEGYIEADKRKFAFRLYDRCDEEGFNLTFTWMENQGIRPNAVTFIAILTACCDSSLITDAEDF